MKKYQAYLTVTLPLKTAQHLQDQCDEVRPLFARAFDADTTGEIIRLLSERAIQSISKTATVELTGEGEVEITKPAPEISDSVKAVINSIKIS